MKLTALGFSSLLHEWDLATEQFVDIGVDKGMQKILVIEGKDEMISSRRVSTYQFDQSIFMFLQLRVTISSDWNVPS